jgi:pyridoxine kinase
MKGNHMKKQPRIMCVNSLSCFGKNALTIALPILSAAGCEAVPLPTVLLSSQPGGLAGYSYRELAEDMQKAAGQWQALGLKFDCIYSGFLSSKEQADIASEILDDFGRNALKFIDPAMADNGRMYAGKPSEFAAEMAYICRKGDIISPNITEAVFMLGEEFIEGPYERSYIEGLIFRLAKAFPAKIILLTGIYFDHEQIGTAVLENGTSEFVMGRRLSGHFHGTGDLFSAGFLGAIMRGFSAGAAAGIAGRLVSAAISATISAATDPRYGLAFEGRIPGYIKELGLI